MPSIVEQTGIVEDLSPEDQAALAAEEKGQTPEAPPDEAAVEGQPQAQIQTNAEAQQAAQEPEKGKKKPPSTIPYDRFKEEHERRQAAEQQALELREKWARLEARMQERDRLVAEADARMKQSAEAAKQPPRPDEAIDPYGAMKWDYDRKIEALETNLQQVQQNVGLTAQQLQTQAQVNDFQGWLQQDENLYRARQPDYTQASQHAFDRMVQFGKSLGVPDEEVLQVVRGLANWVATSARRTNHSAAEAFYNFAQTMGYQPQQNGGQQQQQQAQPNRAQETLRQVQAGQKFQGLSRVPAENDDNPQWSTLGAAEIAEMSEDKFLAGMMDPKVRPILEAAMRRIEMGA